MSSALQSWSATVAATLASTYALDAVSTATGALLVASGLLGGLGASMLAVLAASYAVWGAALRPSLAANWALLQRTGASTCLPSKLAHDMAARRGAGLRTRRFVTSAGYVGAELVKEAPYYLGAAGAVLLVDGVGAAEAAVFLAGANLGAAGYEYGLARLVRGALACVPDAAHDAARGTAPSYASFEADWQPKRYLGDYYRDVEADERQTIAFMVEAARTVPEGALVLVFGSGPTLHHVFPFAERARRIDLCDVLAANLAEIKAWVAAAPEAHDWRPFVRHALACEGGAQDEAAVARREAAARARMGRLMIADLRDPRPLAGAWDVVVSAYCADSATSDRAEWAVYMQRIATLVRPGGMLVVAALWRSQGYRVGDRLFPSADVDAADMRRVLAPLSATLQVEAHRLPAQRRHGYGGIVLARARMPDENTGSRCEPVLRAASAIR